MTCEKGWDEMRRGQMRWHEVKRKQMIWDKVSCGMWSASVKREVQGVKSAVWSVKKMLAWCCVATWSHAGHVLGQQLRNKFAQSKHARRTARASFIDEKGLIIKSKATSAPPCAGTTGIVLIIWYYSISYYIISHCFMLHYQTCMHTAGKHAETHRGSWAASSGFWKAVSSWSGTAIQRQGADVPRCCHSKADTFCCLPFEIFLVRIFGVSWAFHLMRRIGKPPSLLSESNCIPLCVSTGVKFWPILTETVPFCFMAAIFKAGMVWPGLSIWLASSRQWGLGKCHLQANLRKASALRSLTPGFAFGWSEK